MKMKKLLLIILLLITASLDGFGSGADAVVASAFANHKSNIQVQGGGQVVKILSDDNDGSHHQRFIIKLASGQTLLIAHNIDLAKRIADIQIGDTVEFSGEYEWNPQGGVIHWTHRDPQSRYPAGWIKHNGQMYQ
jgi:hypothetical protein